MLTKRKVTDEELYVYAEKTMSFVIQSFEEHDGITKEGLLQQFMNEITMLLPNGVSTKGNYIDAYMNEEGKEIGLLWTANLDDSPYLLIACIYVNEEFRSSGYAQYLLDEASKQAITMGKEMLALGVQKNNEVAINTYTNYGFEVVGEDATHISMIKRIG